MFTLKLLLKRSCWTFIFMALALPVSARVCFLPDSTDCGEGDVDVPDVQVTCATYGGYEKVEDCLEARTNKTAQTCTLNSGCYYPKCAYDSERNCKYANQDKKCLSQDVDGVKCWYAQAKTCTEMGYKTACDSNEYNSTEVKDKNGNVIIDINNKTCYKCTPKKECKQMKPGVYYGPNDTCPQYRPDRKEVDNVKGSDGQCSTCDYQTCSYYGYQTSCAANQSATEKLTKDQASDGPCYKCVDKGDGSYDYIIYIDDTQSQENDKVTISRSVYSTDRNATFDAESVADVTEERCDWNCNCDEGGTSISLANGQTATYWDVNEEAGGGSSGGCDYTRTYVSWNYTKVTVNGTTKEYKNTQCKDGTITDSKGTVYKIVCGIPTCSDIGYQTTPCSTGYKQIDYIQFPHEDCYKCENKKGWGIHYTHEVEDLDTRTYSCTITEDDGGVKADVSTRWKVSVYKKGTASEVEALDGKKYAYIDQHKGEVRYPKGEYNICFDYGRDVYIRPYYIHLATKDEDACDYSWDEDDGRWHPDYNNYDNINKGFCSDENIMTFGGITCMTATFEDNEEYYVQGDFEGNNIDGISEWECTPIATASH